ncbi:hypothetical protein [Haloarcula laminariae]|uniref:hypothetical protein n=1 Tax=Haloarcula laminariae TaxID=2961577 RepID=UPI0021C95350|nr:hypothetical protein [Halomicroarcula laminariae]
MNVPNPFSAEGGDTFDTYDEFVPDSAPEPGPFIADHDVLTGADHLATHRLARSLFEERGVYDMTFGYNLARLNVDRRHPDAGFRYAREADDGAVLRAEFTPTTEFCPQSDTLTVGAMRAFNGEAHRHEYDLVRVRVSPMHQEAIAINGKLKRQEAALRDGEEISAGPAGGSF